MLATALRRAAPLAGRQMMAGARPAFARQFAPAACRSFSSSSDMKDKLMASFKQTGADGGAVSIMDESPKEFMMRWLDVFGLLTRFFNRKVWVLEMEPVARAKAVMVTEFERKFALYLWGSTIIFGVFTFWHVWGELNHLHVRPPSPQLHAAENFGHLNVMFDWLCTDDVVRSQCNHCRWIEADCKKMCYDKLRDLGYDATYKNQLEWSSSSRIWKIFLNGGQIEQYNLPKSQSFPYY